jgi:hypothetical protein
MYNLDMYKAAKDSRFTKAEFSVKYKISAKYYANVNA